ncbi:hypothetical protein [Streptoalloteichus hindustanus]|uniref:Stage II sporulation protein E (SpoIIE) n=1 Tax=Streptoalloteichus hindustanus TaxID=2017 RepID=A0A1M5M7W9_STRHI|nr:hypothetical protein [Streptoalloteichus hindustanus]SHG73352.1 hypothetical protein SAMN05444320_11323 [Streptoalloteichus hindustanus]
MAAAPWPPEELAAAYDRLQRTTLARVTVGTAPSAVTDAELVLLTIDGLHDVLGDDRISELVAAHRHAGVAELARSLLDATADVGLAPQDNASLAVIETRRG